MAVKHSIKVDCLDVKNTPDNIVLEVIVKFTSFDDSNPENTTINTNQRYQLPSEGITSNSQGFIPFDNLTEEIVLGWISNQITEKNPQEHHELWIDSVLNPPPPPIVSRNVPW